MGSLNTDAGRLAAFTGQIYPGGLDLGRCVIQQDLGIFVADPAATILQGQLVTKGVNGILCSTTGKGIIGVAKWNKATAVVSSVVDEPIVLTGTGAVNLKHANVANVKVAAAAGQGAAYTVTTDYTVSAANGTVTRVAGQAIADGATVYVTYTYTLSAADLDFQGRNFFNFLDDVSIQDNHITVIVDWSILFTTQYDTSKVYDLTTAAQNLYAGTTAKGGAGNFTNDATAGEFVGRVIQLPSATDPYMGVAFGGNPIAFA
jgi:hypothetical protein